MAARDGDGWIECGCGAKHWGKFGAAGLLLLHQRKVLLQHRAPWVHNGDTWGIPGGARDSHESPLSAALRETAEETGIDLRDIAPVFDHLDQHPDWSYLTIVAALVAPPLNYLMNQETLELRWFEIEVVSEQRLHPSFARSWPEISGRLRDIVDAIA